MQTHHWNYSSEASLPVEEDESHFINTDKCPATAAPVCSTEMPNNKCHSKDNPVAVCGVWGLLLRVYGSIWQKMGAVHGWQ